MIHSLSLFLTPLTVPSSYELLFSLKGIIYQKGKKRNPERRAT